MNEAQSLNDLNCASGCNILSTTESGEGIVALYSAPNPFLLNKICKKPTESSPLVLCASVGAVLNYSIQLGKLVCW